VRHLRPDTGRHGHSVPRRPHKLRPPEREYFKDYVVHYTNAATLVSEEFEDAGATGLFSGWDEENTRYDPSTWRYEGHPIDYAAVGGSQGNVVGEAGGQSEMPRTSRARRT
jgi:formate dehydrogenase major subunit